MELSEIEHHNDIITFAREKPIETVEYNILGVLETPGGSLVCVLFDHVFWIVVFDVNHQLVDVFVDFKDPDLVVLFHVHDKIVAVVTEVDVDQIQVISIVGFFLNVDFFDHVNLGEIHVCPQESDGEAITLVFENVRKIILRWLF